VEHYATNNCGREWTIFRVNNNAVTNMNPYEAQNDFYYVTDLEPSTGSDIKIVGYGSDFNQLNRDNVQQTDSGPNLGFSTLANGGVIISHQADTEGGNSGSAIQRVGNDNFSYGIHNNGGCGGGGCANNNANSGISFSYGNLNNSLNTVYGNNSIHVSKISNSSIESGSIYRPYDTLEEAENAANNQTLHDVIIVEGNYNETNGLLLNSRMIIHAPVGTVIIE